MLTFILSALASASACQVFIQGRITDKETGEELIGASVVLKRDNSLGVIADENGAFRIRMNGAGSDSLIVSYLGYTRYARYVVADSSLNLLIGLQRIDRMLQGVTVTGSQPLSDEFTVRKVDQLDIYLAPAAEADPLLAVNLSPSSTNTNESGALSLRGTSINQNALFVNEVPVYDYLKFGQISSFGARGILDNSTTKGELLFPSNPPLEYGNVTGGMVAYTTDEKVKDSFAASLSLANASVLLGRKMKGDNSLKVFSNVQTYPLWKFFNEVAFRDVSKFLVHDAGVQLYLKPGKQTVLKLYSYGIIENYQNYVRSPSINDVSLFFNKRSLTILNVNKALGKFVGTVNCAFSASKRDYSFGNSALSEYRNYRYGSADVSYYATTWSTRVGVSAEWNSANASGYAARYEYALSADAPTISIDTLVQRKIPEIYNYTKLTFINRLIIGIGVRKSMLQRSYASSQFNISYSLTDKQSLKVSFGRYHRFTTPQEDMYASEFFSSDQYAVDYALTAGKVKLAASLYKNDLHNQSARAANKIYGGEIQLVWNATKRVSTLLSFTHVNNTRVDSIGASYPDNPGFSYLVKSTMDVRLGNSFSVGLNMLFRNGNRFTSVASHTTDDLGYYAPIFGPTHAQILPNYFRVDLGLSKIIGLGDNKRLILFFQIQNVLDTKNKRDLNYSADYTTSFYELYQQRNFYFGVQFTRT